MSSVSVGGGRRVLMGVPRVGFYFDVKDCGGKPWPEDIIFPSCLRSIMEYRGEDHFDYVYILGTSGGAFFLTWKDGWHADNVPTYNVPPDAASVFRKAFDAIGYEREVICGQRLDDLGKEQAIRSGVISEIDAGRPCLIHGVIGPPETTIITGYDEGGDVLIGWSFFQYDAGNQPDIESEPCGYFRRRNWVEHAHDILMIRGRERLVDKREEFIKALRWAVEIAHTRTTWGGRHNGLAAFDAWIEHLQRDDEIASVGDGGAPDPPFNVHRDATDIIAEGRWYASTFLSRAASVFAYQASHLYAAASCYAREHELVWKMWKAEGGMGRGPEQRARFARPDVRRDVVKIVRECRELDARAADHIQHALDQMK